MLVFHGTNDATQLIAQGYDIEAPRRSDPGDFGWGFYCTTNPARAKAYGEIVEVTLDVRRYAHIPNPYFLEGIEERRPKTALERLFHEVVFEEGAMKTVKGSREERIMTAKQVHHLFMTLGWLGILTDRDELVVFDPSTIMKMESFSGDSAAY